MTIFTFRRIFMQTDYYHENLKRGKEDFPISFYFVDSSHPRYQMSCHWHDDLELIYVLEGKFTATLNGEEVVMGPGDTLFVTGGQLHAGFAENCKYQVTVFDPQLLFHLPDPCKAYIHGLLNGNAVMTSYFPAEKTEIRNSVQQLFLTAFEGNEGQNSLLIYGYLLQFFGCLCKEHAYAKNDLPHRSDARNVRHLKQVLEYISIHYREPISLEQLAKTANMNPKYFCRFFRKMTRRTPMDYVNYHRIECACRALISTEKNVTEVAFECGFNDISYFIKTFREHKGVTPGKYSAALMAKNTVPSP